MTELVVGTAGHVDHGKTTLVKALTGVDCDTLPDERRRSMTIELGFAPWVLPSGREVSIVDVPGHERFIRTMAVGARSVDLALLCVAADDGVMPQTREHAAVLAIIGVRRALVAVTKADLAPERAEAVGLAALELLGELGVGADRWVACSVPTALGMRELAEAVEAELGKLPAAPGRGRPRLLVDRSFSQVGTGTVVTGVLDGGGLTVGDAVEVFPSGCRARVQGLQRRGQAATSAEPGGRLAVALNGVSVSDVPRGSVVGKSGEPWGSQYLDCALSVPPQGARGVRQGMHVDVLCGSAVATGRIWLAGDPHLSPGAAGYGQLHLDSPMWVLPGDRVVLRGPSPAAVLGGGLVLDAHPSRHRRWSTAPLEDWSYRERVLVKREPGGLAALAVLEAASSPLGLEPETAARRAGTSVAAARDVLREAASEGRLKAVGHRYLSPDRWTQLGDSAVQHLFAHERAQPLDPGMPRQRLLGDLGFSPGPDADAALRELEKEGQLELRGPAVLLPGRSAAGSRTASAARIAAMLLRAGANPPGARELSEAGMTKEIRAYLLRSGEAVELAPDLLIALPALEELERGLAVLLAAAADEGLTVAQVRDGLASSRRIVVPLLERFERAGHTERAADLHRLRGRRCQTQCG
ncbi:MAG: selenocysteine-specific translation elongation factor [Candidatus Dormibacteria bacterium]